MLKVAKNFQEPEQSLIISYEKVNVDDGVDKSSSRSTVQPVTQPKAPTNLKLQKKKIPSSSKPKSSHKVRVILLKKQVADTQPAEETVATADATKSLDTSESAKEQVNQPKTAEAKKEEVKESGMESMEDITFDQIIDEIDQKHKAAENPESPLRSMLDDDLVSLTGFKTPDSTNDDFKEGTSESFYASANMPAQSDPLGHLHEELCILNNKIDQLESSITKKVTDDI
ncbi:hypothetical protein Tco_0505363 [Tanacetum coccineum]